MIKYIELFYFFIFLSVNLLPNKDIKNKNARIFLAFYRAASFGDGKTMRLGSLARAFPGDSVPAVKDAGQNQRVGNRELEN